MNSSRQLLLGTGVFLGGGILLFAMLQQGGGSANNPIIDTSTESSANSADTVSKGKPLQTLTADVQTEERILAQKRLERESKVAEFDKRTKEFLTEQERAEALAMEKARLENEKYRTNAIEPVMDEPVLENQTSSVVKPVVQARKAEPQTNEQPTTASSSAQNKPVQASVKPRQTTDANESAQANKAVNTTTKQQPSETRGKAPRSSKEYTVQRGDGLIKIANRYNVPVEALSQANNLSANATLRSGQKLIVPSASQVERLIQNDNAKSTVTSNSNKANDTSAKAEPEPKATSAPTRQLGYKVKQGDGLIKLARQYNVPVEALAEANNMSVKSSLRVGQTLTIPSRRQVERLQREAEQKQKASETKREAQMRLAEARRKAAQGEAKGTFGVQVALADNQEKADAIVKKMRAAGYSASTSKTDRGVRVIVGPEKGKEAALALKDKINADSRTDVNNAWVLYWR